MTIQAFRHSIIRRQKKLPFSDLGTSSRKHKFITISSISTSLLIYSQAVRDEEGERGWLRAGTSRRLSPLLLEVALGVESDDSTVAIAVGDEEGPVGQDGDVGRLAKVTLIVAGNHLHAQNQIRGLVAHFGEADDLKSGDMGWNPVDH